MKHARHGKNTFMPAGPAGAKSPKGDLGEARGKESERAGGFKDGRRGIASKAFKSAK